VCLRLPGRCPGPLSSQARVGLLAGSCIISVPTIETVLLRLLAFSAASHSESGSTDTRDVLLVQHQPSLVSKSLACSA